MTRSFRLAADPRPAAMAVDAARMRFGSPAQCFFGPENRSTRPTVVRPPHRGILDPTYRSRPRRAPRRYQVTWNEQAPHAWATV